MIGKELFVECIENMRLQLYEDKKNGEFIQEAFQVESFALYDNSKLINTIMNLLRQYFPRDNDGFCAIESYCFDMNFGKIGENEFIPIEHLWIEVNKKIGNE